MTSAGGHGSSAVVVRFLQDFTSLTTGLLHAITHHEYIEIDATNVLNTTFLDQTAAIGKMVVSAVRSVSPTMKIWAGEIGPHNGAGSPRLYPNCADNKVCGRFGSALWYADSMCSKAKVGYGAFFRQDFIGADYGLLNYSSYAPSPDYWTLVLWRRVVGSAVIDVTLQSSAPAVRVYGFCATRTGSMTLVFLNLSPTEAVCVSPPEIAQPTARTQVLSL